jgi:hypothetical protein
MSQAELDALHADEVDAVAAGLVEAEAAPAPDPAGLEDGVWAAPPPTR